MPLMKKIVGIVLLLGVAATAWWVWRDGRLFKLVAPSQTAIRTGPSTVKAERRTIRMFVESVGDINPANQVAIKSEVNGRVRAVHVTTGKWVAKGDLLVSLDDTDFLTERASAMTEIEGARLRMRKAERDFERNRALYAEKLVSREMYDNATTEVELTRNEFDKAQKKLQSVDDRLNKIRITAPFEGTVLSVLATPGQVVCGATGVNEGTTLMMLANLNEMVIGSHVNQVDVIKLQPGQRAQIRVNPLADTTLEGEITLIAPVATGKNNIKGFNVDILITRSDPRIRPGMSANLVFPVSQVSDALSVPISAVFIEDGQAVVYVQTNGEPERRVVQTGVSDARHTQILNGVTEGETLLLEKPAIRPAAH